MIFLFIFFYSLFSCTHREVKSVPLLPAQPRAARHERRCRNPLAVLFRCGAEQALMPAGSAHLFPRPRLLSALEGGSLPGILSSPSRRCRRLPAFPKSGGCHREPGPSGRGQTAPQGHGSPCGGRPGSARLQSLGSTARSLARGSGPCPGCGVHGRQPPTHSPAAAMSSSPSASLARATAPGLLPATETHSNLCHRPHQ